MLEPSKKTTIISSNSNRENKKNRIAKKYRGRVVSVIKKIAKKISYNNAFEKGENIKNRKANIVPTEKQWGRSSDQEKMEILLSITLNSPAAEELKLMIDENTVVNSIRNNLELDFEGERKSRFSWGSFAIEKENCNRRVSSDLNRLKKANQNIDAQLSKPKILQREEFEGELHSAAATWITNKSTSSNNQNLINSQVNSVINALDKFCNCDVFDIRNIGFIHDAIYKPTNGQINRKYRNSSDPVFMGSDIGRAGFEKALIKIKESKIKGEKLADALFLATVRYHPFGDANGRTARTLYALTMIQTNPSNFHALSDQGESILNPKIL